IGLLTDSLFVVPDTINPIYQKPLYQFSSFINKRDFYRRKLFYAADIFELSPFFFDVSHGLSGYPGSIMMYGAGPSSVSVLVNGINYNDYSSIPFDFNRLQTEYIDSAEIIPLPRGFLYGMQNTISTINFIGKDFLSAAPYSRIKYYEGPYGEAFVDGMFNFIVFNRFILFIDITNKKVDTRYLNSDYSQWNGRFQLKYFLNNNFNLISGYEYSNTNTGANGGIDVLNMTIDESGFFEALYSEISSPVVFPALRYNTFGHTVFLRTLGSFGSYAFTDATIYYRFNRHELNGDLNSSGYLDNLYKNKITGVSLKQDIKYKFINFKVLGNFESAEITRYEGFSNNRTYTSSNMNRLGIGGIASASLFNSLVHPSLFYKISREKISETLEYSGYGGDINITPGKNYKIYTGYSKFENNRLSDKNIKNFQAGLSYNSYNFQTNLNYFSREGVHFYGIDTILKTNSADLYPADIQGLSLSLNVLISKILLEGKIDYYREANKDNTDILPTSYIAGGVYYKDSLFNGNLDLKTGFNVSWYGKRNLNLSPQYFYLYQGNTAGPDMILNFTLSGEIQERAIIFFLWENLLDRKYFIVPFYPMPPRGIRFGVSWELFN
ncbi:MAG: hypothetical protein EHM47_16920, partial [Ignavibacteriales bacterium]